ncbi:MAG: GGDEF domain-containing protein, partial [Nitrospinaceae bacterium]
VHQQEGVRPDLYLSASKTLRDLILKTLHPYLADHPEAAGTLEALEKIFYFDLSLVFDTYIQTLVTEVEKERRRAATYAAEMEKVSCTDGLTGLGNQRLLMATLRHDLEIARRRRAPLSLVYFDVDRFKQINDTQGHQRGDAILQTVGECLRSILRASDTACRYGGDEFAVILNDCTRHQAATFCSRLIEAFSSRVPGVTFSIGIEEAGPGTLLTSQELIARADRKMYLAKDKTGFRFEI